MYGKGCNVIESGDPHVDFPTGARVDVTHIADQSKEKVLQRFKGRQYDMIYFDEGTGFTWECFTAVYSRNRGKSKWTGKVRMTTNPKRSHWLREFLDWYIGVDGFIIPERNGVVRYFYINGETVKDVVIVFTYEYDVNKVDGAGEALTGAGFTLYKKVGSEWVAVGNEIVGGDITTFEFKGLDSGDYKLVETTVPTGYNKADDIEFTITASYDIKSNNPQFHKLTINGKEYTTGIVVTEVENLTGTELPSTGGIGTTIFYVAGGILVVGAAVMLIAKKRTENEE
jgi:LPXTG-motif cell wall-anchored protein